MATRTRRSKRGPKLTQSSVKAVATTLITSTVSSGTEDLTESVLKKVTKLPELDLYSERKKFLEIVQEQCREELGNLVSSLCHKYSTLYGLCHGKDGYLKFQIGWHDFLTSVAAFVDMQSTSDAQVDDCEDSTSPVANSWLSLVTTVQSSLPLTTETQFSMLHAIARQVYHHMHEKTLAAANPPADQPVPLLHSTEANGIESLIRMCGSQLTRIYIVKTKELERLNKLASSSMKSRDVEEQIALIEEACLTKDGKDNPLIKPILPVCDDGGMRFPCPNLFPFLREFDSVARQEINYHTFHKLGELAFKSMQNRMEQNKDRLFPLFSSCFGKFSSATITEVYTLLFDKMVNLRKKEMERSWERLDTHTGKSVTLNLRDELKPFAAKQK